MPVAFGYAELIESGVNTLSQLTEQIADKFSKEELTSVCFELGIDYDDLPAEGKAAKALELVDYMRRRGRLNELLEVCARRRDHIDWSVYAEPVQTAEAEQTAEPAVQERAEPVAQERVEPVPVPDGPFWSEPHGEPAWVEIPAGDFWLGDDGGRDNEKPAHQVRLERFRIARTPLTNVQYHLFIVATGYPAPEHWSGLELPDAIRDHPVRFVGFYDALAYCKWLSEMTNRKVALPSEAQWEKAARGDRDQRRYPWGDTADPARANTQESGRRSTTSVGRFTGGASPYGVLDMCGNVWEWTLSAHRPYPYDAADGRESEDDSTRVLRGGAFYSPLDLARCSYRNWERPGARQRDDGFRVVTVS